MANNIAVAITADVVDLQAKRAIMSAELKAATKDLNAFAKEAAATGATDELRTSMLVSAEAAEKARAKVALVTQELKDLNKVPEPPRHGFEAITASISETGVHLRESIGMFSEFRAALSEVAEVVMVAFAMEKIAEWAEQMGEAAEKTKHLAETFGMSVPEVQGLDAIAKATGMDFDGLAKGMGILDKNTIAAADGNGKAAVALKAVGVAANDGKTQMERMLVIADKFKEMDNGPKKVALAMELFGKSGKDLIPILNMGSEGLQEMDRVTQDYAAGAMFATSANKELRDWLDQVNARGMALADATDTTKIAMQGLGNVMTDAFSPILTSVTEGVNAMVKAFIESYREGGTVAIVMGAITTVLEAVWEVVKAMGEIFYEVFSAIVDLVGEVASDILEAFGVKTPQAMRAAEAAWNIFKDAVIIAKDIILICIESIIAFVQELAGDLMVLGRVAYDAMTLNWGSIEGDWVSGLARVGKRVEETTSKIQAHAKEMQQAMSAASRGEVMPGKAPETRAPKSVKDFDPELGGKGKKEHKTPISQKLEEELEAKKTAWAMEQQAQGTYEAYSLQSEANFWAQALKRTDLSAKDKLEVERKWLAAVEALRKEGNTKALEEIKAQEDAELQAAKSKAALGKIGIQEQIDAVEAAAKLGTMSAAQSLSAKRALNQQMMQIDIDLIQAEKTARLAALNAELANEKLPLQEQKKINDQIIAETKKFDDQLVLLNKQKNAKLTNDTRSLQQTMLATYQQIAKGFGDSIGRMLTFQQGFATTFKQMWQNIQQVAAQAISRMVQNWIMGLVVKDAATKTSAAVSILHSAKEAAAGAWASVVHIPIIGPILAPIAAAAAFAGTMAFASAEGGDWQVRGGPYMLHKDEMVLPAWAASPLRTMITSGNAPKVAANDFAGGGGDTHIHINALDSRDVARFMRDNGRHVAAGVKSAVRNGYRG